MTTQEAVKSVSLGDYCDGYEAAIRGRAAETRPPAADEYCWAMGHEDAVRQGQFGLKAGKPAPAAEGGGR